MDRKDIRAGMSGNCPWPLPLSKWYTGELVRGVKDTSDGFFPRLNASLRSELATRG